MTCIKNATDSLPVGAPRVLVMSERNIYEPEVWRCAFNEFEGILPTIEAVDIIAPSPARWYQQRKRVALRAGKHLSTPLSPGIQPVPLNGTYDLFFTVCEKPSELLNVNAVKGWKQRCKTSICWLTEFYMRDIPTYKSCMEVLAQFDHVILLFTALQPFERRLRAQCSYLPPGVDALQFCPYPVAPPRSIDVLSIGRRSADTHEALLDLARRGRLFYIYDSLSELRSRSLEEHRFLMASLAQRSRYFIVNPSKRDSPGETGGQSEFGYRYFEASAAGSIMIGERPSNTEFDKIFDWEDALIDLPFGSTRVGDTIAAFDAQPERQERLRRASVMHSLLRHDWAYRWEAILRLAGLAPIPALRTRQNQLRELSRMVENSSKSVSVT